MKPGLHLPKFILNRPDDRDTLSKGRIIANTLIWLFILFAGYVVLYVICMGIYGAIGIIPTKLTQYGADPFVFFNDNNGQPLWKMILWALIVGPLAEELVCQRWCFSWHHLECFTPIFVKSGAWSGTTMSTIAVPRAGPCTDPE